MNNYKKPKRQPSSRMILTASMLLIETKISDPVDVLRTLAMTMIIVAKNIGWDLLMVELLLHQVNNEIERELNK